MNKTNYHEVYNGPAYLAEFFTALVNCLDNSIVEYVSKSIINRLKMAIKGEAVMKAWCNYGTYKKLFYPKISPLTEQNLLDSLTGVSNDQWASNVVPFICDTIYNVTSDTCKVVDIVKVRNSEKLLADLMNRKHNDYYRYLLQYYSSNSIAKAYKKLTNEQKRAAKNDYINAITDKAWVDNKIAAYELGRWKEPEWELFHHWNKIMMLGASLSEVNNVINKLIIMGLPISSSVNAGNWHDFSMWLTIGGFDGKLKWQDFSEAREAMNVGDAVGGFWIDEVYSTCYMCSGEPGYDFRKESPSPGSCFSAGTAVCMADGTLREISTIKRGDEIATPRGAKRVMFVSTPKRGSRSLYSFGGQAFQFSGTHPFVTEIGYVCIEPVELCRMIPTFQKNYVTKFREGVELIVPSGKRKVVVNKQCHVCDNTARDELLYDLIPETDESGLFEYYVGDEQMQYLVAAEVPVITGREYECRSFVKMFSIIAEPLLAIDIPNDEYWEYINKLLWEYAKHILPTRFAVAGYTLAMNRSTVSVDASIFSEYSDFFENTDMNIRIGLLFAATFRNLLPLFLRQPISLGEAEIMGSILLNEIRT